MIPIINSEEANMKLPITGGCLCGTVRYTLKSLPKGAGFCHCRTCQRATGSGYFPFMYVTENDLEITGKTTPFLSTGSRGKQIQREFCETCGSLLFGKFEFFPGFRTISASSLDNPSEFTPQVSIWIQDKQPWDSLNKDLKHFHGNPE